MEFVRTTMAPHVDLLRQASELFGVLLCRVDMQASQLEQGHGAQVLYDEYGIYIYIHIHICIYTHTHMYVCVYRGVRVYIHIHVDIWAPVRLKVATSMALVGCAFLAFGFRVCFSRLNN